MPLIRCSWMRTIRTLWTIATLTSVVVSVVCAQNPFDYDYDGRTTYCYWVKQGMSVVSLDYSYVKIQAKGNECPLVLSITQTTTGRILPQQEVEYEFKATLNLNDNKFGMKALEATIPDPVTQRPVQVGHANIHTCTQTTTCDVFRNGGNRKISDQETSNFTDGSATFRHRLAYDRAGQFNVFAHVVLPPRDPFNESYHFVVFTTTTVLSTETSTTTTVSPTTNTSLSAGTMISIIVGSVALLLAIVLGVIFYRRKRPIEGDSTGHFRNSVYMPNQTTKNSRMDWTGPDPEYQFGHDRYQASLVSQFRQPPGLSASALDDRSSRHTKQTTVSSSGGNSSRGATSPNHLPSHRAGAVAAVPGLGKGSALDRSSAALNTIRLPENHGVGTYETYYHHDSDYDHFEYDPRIGVAAQSYSSRGGPMAAHSIARGSYRADQYSSSHPLYHNAPVYDAHYDDRQYPQNYDRESDMSSLNDYDAYDRTSGHVDRPLRRLEESARDTTSSMGTVDFATPTPVRRPAHPARHSSRGYHGSDRHMSYASDGSIHLEDFHYEDGQYRHTSQSYGVDDSYRGTERFAHPTDTYSSRSTEPGYRSSRAVSADSESYEF